MDFGICSCKYDQDITVFSPSGRLLQVEYAQKAVNLSSTAVGICGEEFVVLGVDKGTFRKLQDERFGSKISELDDHIIMTFAGLKADARILTDRAKVECQSHKLMVEEPASVEYISFYIANMQQRYTQTKSRRPFGVAALIAGIDKDGSPRLFQTDPSGINLEWRANAIGRNSKTVLQFLELKYTNETASSVTLAINLAIQALILVTDGLNVEIAVLKRNEPMKMLDTGEILTRVMKMAREIDQKETSDEAEEEAEDEDEA